ncbi:MAG: hypothetical protein ACLFS9_02180 [Nitriliruptoraceae bacterium]
MQRPRLVEAVSTSRFVVVEAPSGAGKSTLLAKVADAHAGPVINARLTGPTATRGQLNSRLLWSLRRHGLSDLVATLGRPDDVDPVDALLGWAAAHEEVLLLEADSLLLGHDDLRFRPEETRELLGDHVTARLDDTEIELITQRCDGWAAAVGLVGDDPVGESRYLARNPAVDVEGAAS